MALVRKPEQRTEGYGKPFVVKKVRSVEKVSCPRQENQTEAHQSRADPEAKSRQYLITRGCHLTLALSGGQHTPQSGVLQLLVRDEQPVSPHWRLCCRHKWRPPSRGWH